MCFKYSDLKKSDVETDTFVITIRIEKLKVGFVFQSHSALNNKLSKFLTRFPSVWMFSMAKNRLFLCLVSSGVLIDLLSEIRPLI